MTIRGLYTITLFVLLSVALIAFLARDVLGMELMVTVEAIISALAVLALGLGYKAAKTPKEIPPFGDPVVDEEIDEMLRRRAPKTKAAK